MSFTSNDFLGTSFLDWILLTSMIPMFRAPLEDDTILTLTKIEHLLYYTCIPISEHVVDSPLRIVLCDFYHGLISIGVHALVMIEV
jgi:hypothetical protein